MKPVRKRIRMGEPRISREDVEAVAQCVKAGWISGSAPAVKEFEETFAKYVGTKYAVSVCNGTAALQLALVAAGVGGGHEVIVCAHAPVYPINAILHTGATPVLVDARSDIGLGIAYDKIRQAVTPRTKAVIVVHWYGIPDRADFVRSLLRDSKQGIVLIEDTAEALGAELNRRRLGSIGDMGCFSFFPNKQISCGEGGMVTTSDEELFRRLRSYRSHCYGEADKFTVTGVGYNFRLSGLSAALGLSQLRRIDEFLKIRRELCQQYERSIPVYCSTIGPPENSLVAPWMYPVLLEKDFAEGTLLAAYLDNAGIETRRFYRPVCSQPAYDFFENKNFPNAYSLWNRGLTLPLGNTTTLEDVEYICKTMTEFRGHSTT